MAAREYQGAGGLRLHLDEPLSGEMAKQVARGHLVLVADGQAEQKAVSQALEDAGETVTPGLSEGLGETKRPNANSSVADWRAYAVTLGMDEKDAAEATKKDCQEYVQVVEDAQDNDGLQV
ncbi:hypothetical protein ACIOEX_01600 [Streptomyces sp. NPDC087850]|uniref:hypothetical protein n=1 Tax=Streptomyces sp. NPDC087850 TaxID=3365809 RepID=UPI0037FA61CA